MKCILNTSSKDGEKVEWGKWFTLETFSIAREQYCSLGNDTRFLCKGNGVYGKQTNSICIDESSKIGEIITIYPDKIIVDLYEEYISDNLLKSILDGKFNANMRCIITALNEDTNEVLNFIILSYDLYILHNV